MASLNGPIGPTGPGKSAAWGPGLTEGSAWGPGLPHAQQSQPHFTPEQHTPPQSDLQRTTTLVHLSLNSQVGITLHHMNATPDELITALEAAAEALRAQTRPRLRRAA